MSPTTFVDDGDDEKDVAIVAVDDNEGVGGDDEDDNTSTGQGGIQPPKCLDNSSTIERLNLSLFGAVITCMANGIPCRSIPIGIVVIAKSNELHTDV